MTNELNIAANLTRTAERQPDDVAIKLDDFTLTWSQLDDATQRLATFLADQGVGVGDRVALSLPNVPAFPVVAYGVWRAGAVLVPMNPLFMGREIDYYFEDAGVKLAFGMAGEMAKAAEQKSVTFVEVGDDQVRVAVVTERGDHEVARRRAEVLDVRVRVDRNGRVSREIGAEDGVAVAHDLHQPQQHPAGGAAATAVRGGAVRDDGEGCSSGPSSPNGSASGSTSTAPR